MFNIIGAIENRPMKQTSLPRNPHCSERVWIPSFFLCYEHSKNSSDPGNCTLRKKFRKVEMKYSKRIGYCQGCHRHFWVDDIDESFVLKDFARIWPFS